MKRIIKRNLSLDQKYVVVDKQYVPILEGGGACCYNCGQLIANIATVKGDDGRMYNIGFDCLETVLYNNSLLSQNDMDDVEKVKKMIPKVLRFAKLIKEKEEKYKISGLAFEKPIGKDSSFFVFYYMFTGVVTRNNDYVNMKNMDFDFLLTTLRNIFPKLTFIVKE